MKVGDGQVVYNDGAGGGGRTHMLSEERGILSPVRLPVPPLQQVFEISGLQYRSTRRKTHCPLALLHARGAHLARPGDVLRVVFSAPGAVASGAQKRSFLRSLGRNKLLCLLSRRRLE